MKNCKLNDLGFVGARFTWINGRHDESLVKEQLDHAIANMEWKSLYREVAVHVLAARTSDHKPFLMHFPHKSEERMRYHKGFKFEAKWQLNSEYGAVIEEAWHEGGTGMSGLQTMQNKLAMC